MKVCSGAVNANNYNETDLYWDYVEMKYFSDEDYVRILIEDFGHKKESAEFSLKQAKKAKARRVA